MSDPRKEQPVAAGGQPPAEADSEIRLLDYWRILVERRAMLLGCLAVTVAFGILITLLSTPRYLATTTLQIERHGPDILTFQDVVGSEPLSYIGYVDFYQTQYKIIQSKTVLRLAAERLDLTNRPELLERKGSPLSRLYRWIRRPAPQTGGSGDPLNRAVGFIAGGLQVTPIRDSHLVSISFMDRHPVLAKDVANAVSDAYQQFSLEARYTTTEQASEFLTKEVIRLQSEIAELERGLQQISKDKEILALSDGTRDISEQALADHNARLTDALGRMALAKARYDEIVDGSADSLPEVMSSPLITHLRQQYAEIERRYTQAAQRFKPGWPALAELEEELNQAHARLEIETNTITSQVRQAAGSGYEQAAAEVINLRQQVEQQKIEVQRVNSDAIEYASLKDEIKIRREVLAGLVTRQSETETSGQLRGTRASNIRVVDRAETPASPARPRKIMNLMVSIMIGLILGVGMTFLLHHVDNSIKTEQDIERYGSGVAVLGHVPLYEPLRVVYGGGEAEKPDDGGEAVALTPPTADLASHETPRSSFGESFKNLRTSLLLASPDHPPRHIQVTSCEPGEGKSTIVLNLAVVLTQMGKKVLLVDTDLRRPRLHSALGLPNDVGLSSFLTGNAEPRELFQECAVPGLSVITSGPMPPNPSELLGSPRLDSLIEQLRENGGYDHVLFDSPPVIQVADSMIIATKMNATILIVRAGMTARESLAQGVARLRQGRAKVIGAVLNAISERSRYYYYRRYGYHRRSGYYTQDGGRKGEQSEATGALAALTKKMKRSRQRRAG